MPPACSNCDTAGHGYDDCPKPKSPRCNSCKRVIAKTGHAPTCRRAKTTGQKTGPAGKKRPGSNGGRPAKPRATTPAASNGALTLKGALAKIEERLVAILAQVEPLETERVELAAARTALLRLVG